MNAGLVIVDKPAGMTSHDVVGRCRRIFGTRRVGHAGTLDPMATGVLVIGVDRATKILGLLTGASKSYAATIRLGQTTSTEDAEGELLQEFSTEHLTEATIAAATSCRCRRRSARSKSAGNGPIGWRARGSPWN
jgi:tRNA pseudouridine55 synthase